jgi:plasmid stabilization system protein ParE
MPRFELRIAPGAMAEIQAISRWWRANRLLAPRLFDRELDAMFEILEFQPNLGKLTRLRSLGDVRVAVLRRSRYLVAYRVHEQEQCVWIVRVRHGSRRPLARR